MPGRKIGRSALNVITPPGHQRPLTGVNRALRVTPDSPLRRSGRIEGPACTDSQADSSEGVLPSAGRSGSGMIQNGRGAPGGWGGPDHRARHRPGSLAGGSTADGMISRTGVRGSAPTAIQAGHHPHVSPAHRPVPWPWSWPYCGPRTGGTAQGNAGESIGPPTLTRRAAAKKRFPAKPDRHSDTEEATSSNLVPLTSTNFLCSPHEPGVGPRS